MYVIQCTLTHESRTIHLMCVLLTYAIRAFWKTTFHEWHEKHAFYHLLKNRIYFTYCNWCIKFALLKTHVWRMFSKRMLYVSHLMYIKLLLIYIKHVLFNSRSYHASSVHCMFTMRLKNRTFTYIALFPTYEITKRHMMISGWSETWNKPAIQKPQTGLSC